MHRIVAVRAGITICTQFSFSICPSAFRVHEEAPYYLFRLPAVATKNVTHATSGGSGSISTQAAVSFVQAHHNLQRRSQTPVALSCSGIRKPAQQYPSSFFHVTLGVSAPALKQIKAGRSSGDGQTLCKLKLPPAQMILLSSRQDSTRGRNNISISFRWCLAS